MQSSPQGSLWSYPDWPISGGINKLNYKREIRWKAHCAYFETLWLMEHQVSRKCYVSLQAKVRMSYCTDRRLAFVNTVTSFFKKKVENILTSWPTISFHRGTLILVHLILTHFVCPYLTVLWGHGQTSEYLLDVSL